MTDDRDIFINQGTRRGGRANPRALIPLLYLAVLLIAWRRWGWRESIGAHYLTEITRADRQQLPASLQTLNYHHAPQFAYKSSATDQALLDAPEAEEEPGETPTMA